MTKLILKTASITLACIVGVCALLFGAFILFCPSVLGKVSSDLGNDSASAYFYRLQADKSNGATDIAEFIYKLPSDADAQTVEKYAFLMIENKDFDKYLDNEGSKIFGSKLSACEFFYTKAVLSSFNLDNTEKSLTAGTTFVAKNGYTMDNPLRVLVTTKASLTDAEKTAVRDCLNAIKTTASVQELVYITADLGQLA